MIGPIRAIYSFRPRTSAGVFASAIAVAVLFSATPFAIPEVADRYDISLGLSGMISALQVTGFAAASFLGGRFLRPSRRLLVSAAGVAMAANVLSALNESFELLLLFRLIAGAAAGILIWISWTDAMAGKSALSDVAAAGPLAVLVASPAMAALGQLGDDRAIYAAVAVAYLPPMLLPVRLGDAYKRGKRLSPSRSNLVLLAALGIMTMAGSSLFVFAASQGQDVVGMSPMATSIGYSLNAGAGIVGTRVRARPGSGGLWLMGTGLAAASMVLFPNPVVFYATMATWGFSFWLGLPEVFRQISAWSLAPQERIGDAQAIMALGRAAGPALGGAVLAETGFVTLGLIAGLGLGSSAGVIGGVEAYRHGKPSPAGSVVPASHR